MAAKKVMSIIVPVAVTEERRKSSALPADISRYTNRLRNREYTTATAAASVGVMTPPYIPPRMMTGRMMPPIAVFVFPPMRVIFSAREICGRTSTEGIRVLTRYTLTALNMAVSSTPGTSVDRKHAATDWPVTKAYMIIVMLGGISVLRTAAELMSAAEYPLS